ncbi:excisionase [Umezawaea sp. NPDC059074]|uniref:excisionase n=1 Tax=Umezawaea sp. NPDC059074 TaxID=3346716 RepID=UPI0036D10D49
MADVEPLWGVVEVSIFLGVPVKTLYQWKWQRLGPPVRKVGKYLRYVPAKVRAWAEEPDDQAA